jgi:hypothetical protein
VASGHPRAQSAARSADRAARARGARRKLPPPGIGHRPIEEAEISELIQRGGTLENVIVETHPSWGQRTIYVIYLLPSWRRGYCLLHVWRQKSVRAYKDFSRLLKLVRTDFRYSGPITVQTCEPQKKAVEIKSRLPRADFEPD